MHVSGGGTNTNKRSCTAMLKQWQHCWMQQVIDMQVSHMYAANAKAPAHHGMQFLACWSVW